MSDDSARLHLPQLVSLQELNAITWNEALEQLDALVDLCLLGQFVNDPPAAPQDGDAYLIGGAPTGAWTGYAYKIASCRDGGWRFYMPFDGLRAYLPSAGTFVVYRNGIWTDVNALISSNEVSLASAGTCDIAAANALFVQITGTTSITSFGSAANKLRYVRFAGALTLTHSPALSLLGGASRTTAAGDCGVYASDASGNWRERSYVRAASNPGDAATKSGVETLSNKTFCGATYIPSGVWAANGYVGIRTTTPGCPLEIKATSNSSSGGIRLIGQNGTSTAFFLTDNNAGGTTYNGFIMLSANSGGSVQIQANGVSYFSGGSVGINTASPNVNAMLDVAGHVFPHASAAYNLGSPSFCWANGYIQNAWTVVSDETLKTEIAGLSDAEMAVAKEIAPLVAIYKMKSAVAEKGAALARKHCGWIAQRIEAVFVTHGLDPFAYGCVGFDPATKTVTKTRTVSRPTTEGEDCDTGSNPLIETIVQSYSEQVPDLDEDGVPRTIHSIRLEELTAFALAGLAARVAALEAAREQGNAN